MSDRYESKIAEITSGMDDVRLFLGGLTRTEREDYPDVIERLQGTLEELHVAHEELRLQNEELGIAQEQLYRERERYRELFDRAPDGYIVADVEGIVRDANDAAHQMLKVAPPYLRGKPLILFFDERSRMTVMREMWKLEDGALAVATTEFEARLKPREGEAIQVSIRAVCVDKNGAGGKRSVRLMVRDVSERAQAQALLRDMNAELEKRVEERTREVEAARGRADKANETKDRFLAALSHELRTPLAPVLATVVLLQRDESLPSAVREQLGMVRQSIEMEARLIDDLLDVSRIATGKLALNKESVDAHGLLRRAGEMCTAGEMRNRMEVTMDLGAEQFVVAGDAGRLTQVFTNILQNAMKFTGKGGRIWISTRNVEGMDGVLEKGPIEISIKDDGVGIAAETLPTLFQVFEQGGAEVTRRYGGLGLGLSISKAIVERHGGKIWAESEGLGKGATLKVKLPTCLGGEVMKAQVGEVWDGKPLVEKGSKRVLLVEDHVLSSRVLKSLLERMGFVVTAAQTVGEAMGAAAESRFDLIVSDIGLPDGTGIELMRKLRASCGMRGICLSGYGAERDLEGSLDAGFSHHLVKPINIDELARVLRGMVGAGES